MVRFSWPAKYNLIGSGVLFAIVFYFTVGFGFFGIQDSSVPNAKASAETISCNAGGSRTLTVGTYTDSDGTQFSTGADLTLNKGTGSDCTFTINGTISLASLTVQTGVTLTHGSNTTVQTNTLTVNVTGNIDIQAGALVNVDSKGYTAANGTGAGASSGASGGGGGAHAGNGGDATQKGGTGYCDQTNPATIGSGGGNGASGSGGTGGGLIALNATSTVTINGSVSANGGVGGNTAGGGGAGGGIKITANTIAGTPSAFTVTGGNSGSGATGGGGGGGCVLLSYTTSNSISPTSTVNMAGGTGIVRGGAGAVYVKQTGTNGDLYVINAGASTSTTQGATSLTANSLTVSTSSIYLVPSGKTLALQNASPFSGSDGTGRVVISAGTFTPTSTATFTVASTTLQIDSAATVSSASSLTVVVAGSAVLMQSSFTTGTSALSLNSLTVQSGGILTHTTNTAAQGNIVNLSLGTLTIDNGGSIDIGSRGYIGGTSGGGSVAKGPGAGTGSGSGGGGGGAHAGNGGSGTGAEGTGYCDISNPRTMGSGGGSGVSGNGGAGGGLAILNVSGTFTLNGTLDASGGVGGSTRGAGGAGGGVNITADTIAGTPQNFKISGGNSGSGASNGGGGGGCALVSYTTSNTITSSTITMTGGTGNGQRGGAGVVFIKQNGTNGDLYVHNSGSGAETRHSTSSLTANTISITNSAIYTVTTSYGLTLNNASPFVNGDSTGDLKIGVGGTFTPTSTTNFTIASTTLEIFRGSTITASSSLDVIIAASGTLSMSLFSTSSAAMPLHSLTIQNAGTLTHGANASTQAHIVNLNLATMTVNSGGSVSVAAKGYTAANGTGAGASSGAGGGGGGAHGGNGGNSTEAGGTAYCSSTNPGTIGSGGGNGSTGAGGGGAGLIILNVTGGLTLNGTIDASGSAGTTRGGGGAGGGVKITAATIAGTPQSFTVAGGASGGTQGGGGGGGCVYLSSASLSFATSTITKSGGTGVSNSGSVGTVIALNTNSAPTASGLALTPARDGTGGVSVVALINDADANSVKLKVEYKSGSDCSYSGTATTTVSSTISATYGAASTTVNNAASDGYQITGVTTTPGANTVTSTWTSQSNAPTANGTFCVFLTPNDGTVDGTTVSTTVILDNVAPTSPGNLALAATTTQSATLTYGSASTETNFVQYKIFYKAGGSGVTESDTAFTSSSDANLGSRTYGSAVTTTIASLSTSTQYVFKIFAYDSYGNNSSSTAEVAGYTLAAVPGTPTLTSPTTSTLVLSLNTATNPVNTTYALYNVVNNKYVAASGASSTSAVYQTAATWGTVTVTGLLLNTGYQYQVIARNGDNIDTAAGATSTIVYTLVNPPSAPSATAGSPTAATLSWSANSNPVTTAYYAEDASLSSRNSGWATGTVSYAFTDLSAGTSYTLRVKARNLALTETGFVTTTVTTNAAESNGSTGSSGGSVIPVIPTAPPPPPPSATTTDDSAPTGLIKVVKPNSTATLVYTNNPAVTLKIDATYADMLALKESETSPSSDFSGAVFDPVKALLSWNLEGEDGKKCINAKFSSSKKGFTYTTYACVILDTTPPTLPQFLVSGFNGAGEITGSLTVQSTAPTEPKAKIVLNVSKKAVSVATLDSTGGPTPLLFAGTMVATYYTTADAAGNWSYTFPTSLAAGAYEISALAEDLAGNSSGKSIQNLAVVKAPTPVPTPKPEPQPKVKPEQQPKVKPEPVPEVPSEQKAKPKVDPKPTVKPLAEPPPSAFPKPADAVKFPEAGAVKQTTPVAPPPAPPVPPRLIVVNSPTAAPTYLGAEMGMATRGSLRKNFVLAKIVEFVANPTVQKANERVAAPVLVTVAAVNVAASAGGLPQLLNILRYLFGQPVLALRRRKQKGWGIVYNSLNKLPVDLAMIRLVAAETGRVVMSQVTDLQGRYFMAVPDDQAYKLEISKPGFKGLAAHLAHQSEDGAFVNLYHGESFRRSSEGQTEVIYHVPIDPDAGSLSTQKILRDRAVKIFQNGLSLGGLVASVVSFAITPKLLLAGFILFHGVSYTIFYVLGHRVRPSSWGKVLDKNNKNRLAKVVVRVFDAAYNKLVGTAVTDGQGRYAILVGPSTYYATYEKVGYEKTKSPPLVFTATSPQEQGGMINRNEELVPITTATTPAAPNQVPE